MAEHITAIFISLEVIMEEEKDFSLTFKDTFNILLSVLSYSHFRIVRNSSGFPSICQTPLKIICL